MFVLFNTNNRKVKDITHSSLSTNNTADSQASSIIGLSERTPEVLGAELSKDINYPKHLLECNFCCCRVLCLLLLFALFVIDINVVFIL